MWNSTRVVFTKLGNPEGRWWKDRFSYRLLAFLRVFGDFRFNLCKSTKIWRANPCSHNQVFPFFRDGDIVSTLR